MRNDEKNIDDAFSDQTEEFVSLEGKTTLPQDELVDEVSEAITAEADEETADTVASAETEEGAEQEEELVEEQVKDEIDIQIDLLNDSEWVVRREAVITLGEMGDERCVEPLVRCLRDGRVGACAGRERRCAAAPVHYIRHHQGAKARRAFADDARRACALHRRGPEDFA